MVVHISYNATHVKTDAKLSDTMHSSGALVVVFSENWFCFALILL